jgi:hypothetical protein
MNAWIEIVMNSENLGARIRENGALDQKIWALEAFRGKMVFLGGFGAILEFFWVVGGSWHKIQGLWRNLGIFGVFGVV